MNDNDNDEKDKGFFCFLLFGGTNLDFFLIFQGSVANVTQPRNIRSFLTFFNWFLTLQDKNQNP